MKKPDPNSLHGDAEFDAEAEREQEQAARVATRTMRALRAAGYDMVLVRIAKVLTRGDECAGPGATVFECAERMLPGIPLEADGLRSVADELDAEFRKRGAHLHEATAGYEENATARMAEFENGD